MRLFPLLFLGNATVAIINKEATALKKHGFLVQTNRWKLINLSCLQMSEKYEFDFKKMTLFLDLGMDSLASEIGKLVTDLVKHEEDSPEVVSWFRIGTRALAFEWE